jgi:MoaA/NifB/PqqE/SkfB family radical SAM enzyme
MDIARMDTFCILAWTHFHTHVDGTVKLCCLSQEPVRKRDGRSFNIRQDNPTEIWNSAEVKQIRQAMLKGVQIPHCSSCYMHENNGFFSRRQYVNEFFPQKTAFEDRFRDRLVDRNDPLTAKSPIYFDLRIGNICNLKCRMCGPESSSQIEKDKVALDWHSYHKGFQVGANVGDWPEAINLLDNLKAFCVDAVRLEVIGGEPTLNDGQLELLQFFVDKGVASEIELLVISNLTNTRERAFELFSKFRDPSIWASLDGTGRVYDYIRFPGKWDAVARNIKIVQQNYPKILLDAAPALQAYNILDICDLFDWCLENGVVCRIHNMVYFPSYLNICVLPMEAREIAAKKLERWVEAHHTSDDYKGSVQRIVSYLRDESRKASDADIDNFVRYTNALDQSRNQDIRASLPEFYDIWSKHRTWHERC